MVLRILRLSRSIRIHLRLTYYETHVCFRRVWHPAAVVRNAICVDPTTALCNTEPAPNDPGAIHAS